MHDFAGAPWHSGSVWHRGLVHGAAQAQRLWRRDGSAYCAERPGYLRSLPAIALGGWLSAIAQGRVAAASINIVAKRPEESTKGIILCGIVEFYAILSLVATILLVLMYQL